MSVILNYRKLNALQSICTTLPRLQQALCSTKSQAPVMEYDRDPQPHFTDPQTQRLLRSMTQMRIDKVFRKTTVPKNSIEYKFMTSEQLETEFSETVSRAEQRLQMPPVVKVKEDTHTVISKDPALTDFSDTKYVFTDITYGLRQSERKVVVRQINGTLEYAPLDVAKRMRQLYFPISGRKIRVPRMFEPEHLERCLDEHKYEFVLNRLAVQFEPYEQEFHRISAKVYQHLNESKQFDALRSTRHFGPMAFFYAWHRCIDDLLYDMVRNDYLRNGAELIALTYKLHGIPSDSEQLLQRLAGLQGDRVTGLEQLRQSLRSSAGTQDIQEEIKSAIGKTREDFDVDDLCLAFIEQFISEHALKKVQLELAVQTLKEINAEKKQLFEGLNKAHGVQ